MWLEFYVWTEIEYIRDRRSIAEEELAAEEVLEEASRTTQDLGAGESREGGAQEEKGGEPNMARSSPGFEGRSSPRSSGRAKAAARGICSKFSTMISFSSSSSSRTDLTIIAAIAPALKFSDSCKLQTTNYKI